MPRAILHIGTEKTGTTALQAALARNRAALAERGFAYPGEAWDHHRLVNCVAPPHRVTQVLTEQQKAEHLAELRAEIGALPPSTTVLFSSELCHFRLESTDDAVRLLRTIETLGAPVQTVVVYYRDQCSLMESSYAEGIRNGKTWSHEEQLTAFRRYFSHRQTAERWRDASAQVDSRPALSIQSYLRHRRSLAAHFLQIAGVPDTAGFDLSGVENASGSIAVIETVKRANQLDPSVSPQALNAFLTPLDPRPVRPFLDAATRTRVVDAFGRENEAMCRDFGLDPVDFPACTPVAEIDDAPLDVDDLVRMLIAASRR